MENEEKETKPPSHRLFGVCLLLVQALILAAYALIGDFYL